MPSERYFLENLPEPENQAFLEGQEFQHFLHVMRNTEGNEIELINGKGSLAKARVETIEKKRSILKILEIFRSPPPTFSIVLAQAIPRFNRLEFILEKGTELGMTEIWLFSSSHSEKKAFSENQLERMQTITIAAMKQCGRLHIPKIVIKPSLKQWAKPEFTSFFGDVSHNAPIFSSVWLDKNPTNGALFFIGPESGFTNEETQLLQDLNATGVKLQPHILRTDTAAISALSLISHFIL